MLSYILDEHVSHALRAAIIKEEPGIEVWVIGEPGAPAIGTLDPELLLWCEFNGCILVTNNRRSMPRHLAAHLAAGHHIPGIFTLDPDMSIGETATELVLIALTSFEREHEDLILHLPSSI